MRLLQKDIPIILSLIRRTHNAHDTGGAWPLCNSHPRLAACPARKRRSNLAPPRVGIGPKPKMAHACLILCQQRHCGPVVVGVAANWAEANQFGVLHLVALPFWYEAAIAFIILDLAVWFQHFLMHRNPLLWRMHAVHHSDRDLDVTTALRFHPFELIVSTFYKSAIVALLGVPLLVALAFELWLNANALFNHSNIRLPRRFDRMLRLFLVTPDMHLLHHSTLVDEQKHNFGFALTLWDRLFGTYQAESIFGAENQKIGLAEIDDARPSAFIWSMKQPMT